MTEELIYREVNKTTWKDLESLFEGKGGPKYCWCMVWRANNEESKFTDGKSRKAFLKSRVESGIPIGILAYLDNEPIAWCSIAPKETYRKLDNLKLNDTGEKIWSIVCFYIKKKFRGMNLTIFLIKSAIEYAQKNNATIIEAYPVDFDSPSYRFMGFRLTFQKHNFVDVGKEGMRRYVMRLKIDRNKD